MGIASTACDKQPSLSPLRLILYRNEVFRLPKACQEIRILSGRAWVTVSEKDLFLGSGDSLALNPKRTLALASPLGDAPLVMEVRAIEAEH